MAISGRRHFLLAVTVGLVVRPTPSSVPIEDVHAVLRRIARTLDGMLSPADHRTVSSGVQRIVASRSFEGQFSRLVRLNR
jgi:hypothetical protein